MPTRERRIKEQERRIPELAKEAGKRAFQQSLSNGNTVLIKKGKKVIAVSPDGSRRVVKETRGRVRIGKGTKYRLK